MKLKIETINSPYKEEENLINMDKLLKELLEQKSFKFPKNCIKRTDVPNIVETGDFASADVDRLDKPELYARTLLNLTFGQNYSISEANV